MTWFPIIILSSVLLSSVAASPLRDDLFELSVIHVNDFHARFVQTSSSAGSCTKPSTCIGGFSRLYTQVHDLLAAKPKSVLLNGGDNFQGTLYYTIGKWNITQEFMNKLPFDATVLGNHEFDDGIAGVVPFIKSLKTPVVCSNINDNEEPDIQGTYTKSVVIERNGKKIGIIGVIYSKTNTISRTGSLTFYPESASVNAEAERLVEEEGVFTNIVLSHVGYDIDQEIAANATGKIGLIVGAHSHTFLYTGDNPPGPDKPAGPYPTIVKNKGGKNVLVVQASAYSKYLGNITVYYDGDGSVAGHSGSPIFLENSIPQDEEINTALEPWNELIDAQGAVVVGSSLVKLSQSGCYYKECNLGNFVADAYVFAYTQSQLNGSWTQAAIGIVNAGGLRTNIDIGNITYGDFVTANPFANTIDYGELQGKYVKEMLEQAAGLYDNKRLYSELNLLQVSGIRVVYNISKPMGEQIVELKIRCKKCKIPVYEDLDVDAMYGIAVSSYVREGGDGFTALTENIKNVIIGQVDIDVLKLYLQHRSPVFAEEEGRITVISDHKIEARGFD